MTEKETKDITYRFEDIDETTVKVSVLNGAAPFETTLTDVTWGMLEDIMNVQEKSKDDPRAIFAFMNDHIKGGASAVPLKHTMSLFASIAEYMAQVMDTQKN